jgi:imidazolonepropionase-like amidohydrolase
VAELVRAGALVVAGSGAGSPAQLPGFALASEIEALATDAGLGPLEALRRATYWASVAAGVQHESGTVTVDKYADLLCVRGDVLRHIDRLTDVSAVFRRGVRLV